MKRLLCGLLFAIWFAIPAFAESDIPSIAIKEEPIFDGLGFSIKGNAGEEYAVTEFHLSKLVQVDLRNQSVTGEKAYKAVVAFKGEKFPVKVISPDFKKFEADIMDPKTIGNPQGVAIPIGHITFKVVKPDPKHTVAAGKLMIKLESEKTSGDFTLLLNELPQPPVAPPKEPQK